MVTKAHEGVALAKVQPRLRKLAKKIRGLAHLVDKTRKQWINYAADWGDYFREAKELLETVKKDERPKWPDWLKAEGIDVKERRSYDYIDLAECRKADPKRFDELCDHPKACIEFVLAGFADKSDKDKPTTLHDAVAIMIDNAYAAVPKDLDDRLKKYTDDKDHKELRLVFLHLTGLWREAPEIVKLLYNRIGDELIRYKAEQMIATTDQENVERAWGQYCSAVQGLSRAQVWIEATAWWEEGGVNEEGGEWCLRLNNSRVSQDLTERLGTVLRTYPGFEFAEVRDVLLTGEGLGGPSERQKALSRREMSWAYDDEPPDLDSKLYWWTAEPAPLAKPCGIHVSPAGSCKLYLGNCLDVMNRTDLMDDESMNLIITDSPYGHGSANGWIQNPDRPILNDGKEAHDLFRACLPHYKRVLRPGGVVVVMCGGGGSHIRPESPYEPTFAWWSIWLAQALTFKQEITWIKKGIGKGWHFRRGCEKILVAYKGPEPCKWRDRSRRLNNFILPGEYCIEKITPGPNHHPTEKPPELAALFIDIFTDPGDVVFDPFMGHASFGVAALKAGRQFRGIELHKPFYNTAKRRLDPLVEGGCILRTVPSSTNGQAKGKTTLA